MQDEEVSDMETMRNWILGLAIVALAEPAVAETPREVAESAVAKWNEALQYGRVDDIVALYADNAMLLAPDGRVSHSAAEIRAFWRALMARDTKAGDYTLDVVDARSDKDGTIVAKTVLTQKQTLASSSRHTLRYTYDGPLYNVLKRQRDGSWRTSVQRWN